MASVMAIVSKAVFEKEARANGQVLGIDDIWATSGYASQNKVLTALREGGDLYLVTVRPPETLCVVARLVAPKLGKNGWRAAVNTTPIRDIGHLRTALTFVNGTPLPTKPGALGMSLQTPRVLSDDDVALLTAEGGGRAKKTDTPRATAKPKAAAKAAAPTARTARTTTSTSIAKDTDVLAKAEAMLREQRPEEALDVLLGAWRAEPSAGLAELITSLSEGARVDPPGLRGKTADARAAWDKHAKRPTATQLPALLEALTDVTSGDAAKRLDTVARWMPDPRIDAALVAAITTAPYRATMTKPFWKRLFELAAKVTDPRQLARLEAKTVIPKDVAATMAEWLRSQVAKLVTTLRPRLGDATPSSPRIASLMSVVATKAASLPKVDELLEAIYRDPADDAARLVYADALLERGDPRGELIAVQLRLASHPDDREARQREKALLALHGKEWLGKLGDVVMAGFRFERGFLAVCRANGDRADRIAAALGDPAWSTVHTFSGPPMLALHPVMRSLRSLTFESYERSNEPRGTKSWRDLLVDTVRPIEELHYSSHQSTKAEVAALLAGKALPKLRSLSLEGDCLGTIPSLAKSPVAQRLERLRIRRDYNQHGPQPLLVEMLQNLRVPHLVLALENWSKGELSFEHDGEAYRSAVFKLPRNGWTNKPADEVLAILAQIPKGTLRKLRITMPGATKKDVARVQTHIATLGLELAEVT